MDLNLLHGFFLINSRAEPLNGQMLKAGKTVPNSFIANLKQRGMIQAAVPLVVLGWVMIQVADAAPGLLHLPAWAGAFLAMLVFAGFPIILVPAWCLEFQDGPAVLDTGTRCNRRRHRRGRIRLSVIGARPPARADRRIFVAATLMAVLCSALPAWAADQGGAATVFLVRHAEKAPADADPILTKAGKERAQALARQLRDAGIEVIYSTDYRRTRDTAAPLASQLGMEITLYDPGNLGDLAAAISQRGGRCLVVGHSNTTPELVGLLGGEPGPPIDEQSEHDRLYVVTIGPDGAVETVVLRY